MREPCPQCYWNGGIEDVGLPPPPGTHDPSMCPQARETPGWPTLADVHGARELFAPITHERALRLAEGAEWAVTTLPKLRALVELVVRIENEAHDGGITDGTMRDVHLTATDDSLLNLLGPRM